MKYNTLNDLFGCELITPPPVAEVRARLDAKLKEDPDYEVWAPLTYHRLRTHIRKNPDILVVNSPNHLISNKGNAISLLRNKRLFLSVFLSNNGYQCTGVSRLPIALIQIHRAMACSFLPPPEELKHIPLCDLQVNHIDGIKSNNFLVNFEWTTNSGNIHHAMETGLFKMDKSCPLTKPVKGTVVTGPNKGYEFIMFGLGDYTKYGFSQPNVNQVVSGKNKKHRGCAFTIASPEEIEKLPRGISKEMYETLEFLIHRK